LQRRRPNKGLDGMLGTELSFSIAFEVEKYASGGGRLAKWHGD